MQPRDPSSVDADDIDLRVPEAEADDPEVSVDDGPDPDNPFSLGTGAGPDTLPPPATTTLRRRKDVGDARPLGPGPIPGPVDGTLDLAEVHPEADETGPEFLPVEPPRRRAKSVVIFVLVAVVVIAIGTAVGATLASVGAPGWASALVVSTVCVALAAVVWRFRRS